MLNKKFLFLFCFIVLLCSVSSENEFEGTKIEFAENILSSKTSQVSARINDFTSDSLSGNELNSSAAACSCGRNSVSCRYDEAGKKICTCQPGYAAGGLGFCVETCNETQTCDNGGSCLNHVCVCLPGTSGPFCKTITDCVSNKFCIPNEYTRCSYDIEQQKATCDCSVYEYRFDETTRTCRNCKCSDSTMGPPYYDFTYCEYRLGKKMCVCVEGYAYDPKSKICKICSCGPNSDWCDFDENGDIVCGCKEGYMQSYSSCLECTCGKHGVCSSTRGKYYYGNCDCDPGYAEHYPGPGHHSNICLECSCGKHGTCVFGNGTQVGCKCEDGYQDKLGVCEMCQCGENSNCSFSGETKVCKCTKGFEDINGFCTDINECVKHNPCKNPTKCINLLGGFKCVCDDGYTVEENSIRDSLVETCQDIDECENSTACTQPNTECLNTPGSYECICRSGYASRGGSGAMTQCEQTSSSSIYTLLLCTSIATLVLTAIAVLYAKRNFQRRGH